MDQETGTAEPRPGVKTPRLPIVESQTLLAAMLLEVPAAETGIRIVGPAGTATEGIQAPDNSGFDGVMPDLLLPDRAGLERIGEIPGRENPARIVVCSAPNDPAAITASRPGRPGCWSNRRRGAGATRLLRPRDPAVLRHPVPREHGGGIGVAMGLYPAGGSRIRRHIGRAGGARRGHDFHRFASRPGLVPPGGAAIPSAPPRVPDREDATPAP